MDWVIIQCVCISLSVMSDSLRSHGLWPARLLCPWDFPGKNTEVGCHFLLQCMKVKSESESEVTQSCPTLCDPVDCSPPGSSVHGLLQARILEWSCHTLLQGIFKTQGSNPHLLHLLYWQASSLPVASSAFQWHTQAKLGDRDKM